MWNIARDEVLSWLNIVAEEEPACGTLSGEKGQFGKLSGKRCQFVKQCQGRSAS